MNLPPLTSAQTNQVLEYLVRVRDLDPDDAMDWIEQHYTLSDDMVSR